MSALASTQHHSAHCYSDIGAILSRDDLRAPFFALRTFSKYDNLFSKLDRWLGGR